ncbi:MAG: flavin-containing monooxygenase [Burkholderiales bacterium]
MNRPGEDEEKSWRDAVAVANIPTLLLLLVQLTGNLRWLDDPYRPSRTRGLGDNDSGGLSETAQHDIRAAALDAMLAWRDDRSPETTPPAPDLLVKMLGVSLGEEIPAEYGPMIAAEMHEAMSARAGANTPGASDGPTLAPPSGFRAIVIGAGMSGLCASVALTRAGIEHIILERHDTVGGTWLENRYPGCGVDVPSHLYSYTFAPHDWTRYFALRDEIHAYFEKVAVDFGVRHRIRFGISVDRLAWNEATQEWAVDTTDRGGRKETLRANAVISAVGAFNKPRMPDLPGLASFEGPSVHTAAWPQAGVDLQGKRVAVIGNGASAMQVVPAIADRVASMIVFQRSAQWAAPFEKFRVDVPPAIRFLLREMPLYRAWYRLRLGWAFNDKSHASLQKDPAWPHPDRAVNELNDSHRKGLTRYLESELAARPDLIPKVLPTYPPFGKRMLLDNGWFRTLAREHIELVTDSVASVQPHGVTTTAGAHYDADVLIWATGFDVIHFLAPMEIRGREGRRLHDVWQGDDARAFLGTTMPGFPNFFCLYGPNTQFGHGGSLISVVERQVHYVVSLLQILFEKNARAIEVRPTVHDAYNARVDAAHERMVWTHRGMSTYYRNAKGRVVVNNPFRIVDVWKWTERANAEDYVLAPRTAP